MKYNPLLAVSLLLPVCFGQPVAGEKDNQAPVVAKASAAPTQASKSADDLKTVLADMNRSAATFKSAQAQFEWVQYTRAVEEKDVQTGQIFFRRSGKDMDAAVEVTKPHVKQAVIKGGKIKMRDPQTGQTTVRDISNNRDDVESLMSLGFGARGDDLLKAYDVTMTGWETVDNVKTARLELVGKTDRLKQFFSKAVLWIDPVQAVPLQQQRLQSSGDYQLVHYTSIKLNVRVPDDAFRLKGASN
jgi:outer membrane lipoprotein-sorting protein